MLDIALQFLRGELNGFFLTKTNSNAVEVKLSKVVDENGRYIFDEGSICATLINVEEERNFKSQLPQYTYVNGVHVVGEPELKLNLHVLFAVNFKKQVYDEALKYLSYLLTFFQAHSCFTSEEYPALDRRIGKLYVELQTLTYEQLNQVWAFIGGKQLPSVIYKIRMIVLQDEAHAGVQPPLTIIKTELLSQ